MAGRIVVLGATGYTGRLTVERLVAHGARPVLAGRTLERLQELAEAVGAPDLETVRVDVLRRNSVFDLVGPDDVLVTLVGPFVRWGDAAARAAIAAPCTYIDSTGEPAFIRRIYEEFDRPARDAGAALMTAMGADWVPGSLAGALALEQGGEAAVGVRIGYFVLGGGRFSAGTRASLVGATLDPNHTFRGGRVVPERAGARVRTFPVRGRQRAAMSVGAAEAYALPQAYPRLREVDVYLGWFGPATRAVALSSLPTSLAVRMPGARRVMAGAGERLAALLPDPEPGRTSGALSVIVAQAHDEAGEPVAQVTLEGDDPYAFTGGFLAWAARRAASAGVHGAGAVGPVAAFGLDALREGVAEAGLAVRPD